MRDQNRRDLIRKRSSALLGIALAGVLSSPLGALSQKAATPLSIVPRLTGAAAPMSDVRIPPVDRPVVDDLRRMRNYPEQPPVIPHSIDGYQLTLTTNRCLDCHKPEFTETSGAPMISVTHFTDRNGNMLSDVAPRRYFCTMCHVQQTDARPLVANLFQGAKDVGRKRQ